ncbi:hypothetical protein SCHPADRAFT_947494 [Schizopora paradoxa]|uniref:Uncharacterized protein n=1 Tax=Schizopora paradoxa TaxID=27342 RepID=A0A0H2R0D5_9AGAM|nr:hypothetical protein SCHPADRAFT_947494 [Schizopora paradoxa]
MVKVKSQTDSSSERRPSLTDILEQTSKFRARDFAEYPHPSKYEKDSDEYKAAVESFFDIKATVQTMEDSECRIQRTESPNLASLKYELHSHYEARDSEKVRTPSGYLSERNVRSRNDLLGGFIESVTTDADADDLRRTYRSVCTAVAEFELNASTLRTNSSAMILSKDLIMQSAANIFVVLRDFRPQKRPDVPKQAEKRMAEWVRTKKGEWVREDSWNAVKKPFENGLRYKSRWEARMRRITNWEFAAKREEAWKAEKMGPHFFAQDKRWTVPHKWCDMGDLYEDLYSPEDKKQVNTTAKKQLRELGVIDTGTYIPTLEYTGDALQSNKVELWGGGWLKRAEAEYDWMVKDQIAYPGDWTTDLLRMHLWWNDVREWTERWRWRNDVIKDFEKTCAKLFLELGKIDGSVSAHEFSVVQTTLNDERGRLLVEYSNNMKIALFAGDKGHFLLNCNRVWVLVGDILHSKGVKQGVYQS